MLPGVTWPPPPLHIPAPSVARPGCPDLAHGPGRPCRDSEARARWGLGGGRGRVARPQPCPAPLTRAWASSAGHFAKCNQSAGNCEPAGAAGRWVGGARSRPLDCWERGAGDVWPGIPEGAEGPGGDESGRGPTIHCRPQPLVPKPGHCLLWVAPGRAGPVALGQAAEAIGGAGWGLSGLEGLRAAVLLQGRPRGSPTRPAPLAGSGHQGNPARGTRGDAAPRGGSRKGRPARRAETSRGRQTLPLPPPLEGQGSQRDKPLGAAEVVGDSRSGSRRGR